MYLYSAILLKRVPKEAFKNVSKLFAIFALLICCLPAMAQNKVVVIPMAGDDLKPLANIVTVAKQNGDFADPVAALASIGDACNTGPYLIVIAPGYYELSGQLVMKECVNIAGSGKNLTVLSRSQRGVDEADTDSAVVLSANQTELRDLSIVNTQTGSDHAVGINVNGVEMSIVGVAVTARSVGIISLNGSNLDISDSSLSVSGGRFGFGLMATEESQVNLINTKIRMSDADLGQIGVAVRTSSRVEMTELDISVSGSTGGDYGVFVSRVGFPAVMAVAVVRDSYIEANTSAIRSDDLTWLFAFDSFLEGDLNLITGSYRCDSVFLGLTTELGENCEEPVAP